MGIRVLASSERGLNAVSSLRSNFAWNSSYQIVRIITPFITTPYLARVLGSEVLGTYSYTCTVAGYFTTFCLLGLAQYGNREIAKVRGDREASSRVFCSILAMQVAIGVFVFLAYLLYVVLLSGELSPYMMAWGIWVAAEVVDISWFFYGIEDFKEMTIRNLAVRVAVIIGIFALVHNSGDLMTYCLLQSVAFAINSWVLWILLRGRISFHRPTVKEVLVHVKPNLILFAPVLAISVYMQFNEVILGNVSGMSEVSFYDNAYKIVTVPLAVIQSLSTVMIPRMSNVISRGDRDSARYYLSVSSWASQLMSFGLMFGIAGIAHEFVPVFFGPGFEACEQLMPLLAPIVPVCAWSGLLGNQYLIPHEQDSKYLVSVLLGAGVSVSFCSLLVRPYGAFGAAVATVCAELTVSVVQSVYVRRSLPLRSFLLDAMPFMLIGLVEFAAVRLVGAIMGASIAGLACQILAGIVVYVAMAYIWLRITHDDRLRLLLNR